MQPKKVGVVILGGSGFGAGELLRIFTQHPKIEVLSVVSSSQPGKQVVELHPNLAGFYQLSCCAAVDFSVFEPYTQRCLISALPNGVGSQTLAPLLRDCSERDVKIIDLAGDFRLADAQQHQRFYPQAEQEPTLRGNWVYGLPELFAEELSQAQKVANPGCLATAIILSLAPLSPLDIIWAAVTAATGSSGAGSTFKITTQHALRHANFYAYKVLNHQHEPEVKQALRALHGSDFAFSFVPQSLPLARGILVTAQIKMKTPLTSEQARSLYTDFFRNSPFIRILGEESAQLTSVIGSNFCDLACACREDTLVVTAALDNLVKGMAGQAVQNLNLMFGMPQTAGLWSPGLSLV